DSPYKRASQCQSQSLQEGRDQEQALFGFRAHLIPVPQRILNHEDALPALFSPLLGSPGLSRFVFTPEGNAFLQRRELSLWRMSLPPGESWKMLWVPLLLQTAMECKRS
ncbi:hypothetical protein EK904_006856, partial [Melospiza melodia maxima]